MKLTGVNGTNICGGKNIACYESAAKQLFSADSNDNPNGNSVKDFREKCNCLPACTTITYDASVDSEKYNFDGIFDDDIRAMDDSRCFKAIFTIVTTLFIKTQYLLLTSNLSFAIFSKLMSAIYVLFEDDSVIELQRVPLYRISGSLCLLFIHALFRLVDR